MIIKTLYKKLTAIILLINIISFAQTESNLTRKTNGDGGNDSKWGYVDKSGNVKIPFMFSTANVFKEGFAYVRNENFSGFIDENGSQVFQFDLKKYYFQEESSLMGFENGYLLIKDFNNKYCFINKKGNAIGNPYHEAKNFHDGLAAVSINDDNGGKCGYIDTSGREVIPLKYISAGDFYDGLAKVSLSSNNKVLYGFIDKSGNEVIPCRYEVAGDFSEEKPSLAKVSLYGRQSYLDKKGNENLLYSANFIGKFREELAEFYYDEYNIGNKKYGYIDKNGKEIIPRKYDLAYGFSLGVAIVAMNTKEPEKNSDGDEIKTQKLYGVIDNIGNIVVPITYDEMGSQYSEGLVWVKKVEGQFREKVSFGFIDREGKLVIPFERYLAVGNFHNGLAWVKDLKTSSNSQTKCYDCVYDKYGKKISGHPTIEKNSVSENLFGYIDKQGIIVIPLQYKSAGDFENGTAKVKQTDGVNIISIDKLGNKK